MGNGGLIFTEIEGSGGLNSSERETLVDWFLQKRKHWSIDSTEIEGSGELNSTEREGRVG